MSLALSEYGRSMLVVSVVVGSAFLDEISCSCQVMNSESEGDLQLLVIISRPPIRV